MRGNDLVIRGNKLITYLLVILATRRRHRGQWRPSTSYRQVSIGWGKCTSRRYRKSPDHGDWWIVKGMKSSHFLHNSDICRTTCVSGAEYQTPDSYIAVLSVILYKCQKFDVIGRGKCVSLRYRKSPDHSDWWNVLPTDRSYFRYMSDICRTT